LRDRKTVRYGRIVLAGLGVADTIGDGDGAGWAFAARAVTLATQAAARMIPVNNLVIRATPFRMKLNFLRAYYP